MSPAPVFREGCSVSIRHVYDSFSVENRLALVEHEAEGAEEEEEGGSTVLEDWGKAAGRRLERRRGGGGLSLIDGDVKGAWQSGPNQEHQSILRRGDGIDVISTAIVISSCGTKKKELKNDRNIK